MNGLMDVWRKEWMDEGKLLKILCLTPVIIPCSIVRHVHNADPTWERHPWLL